MCVSFATHRAHTATGSTCHGSDLNAQRLYESRQSQLSLQLSVHTAPSRPASHHTVVASRHATSRAQESCSNTSHTTHTARESTPFVGHTVTRRADESQELRRHSLHSAPLDTALQSNSEIPTQRSETTVATFPAHLLSCCCCCCCCCCSRALLIGELAHPLPEWCCSPRPPSTDPYP